MEEAPTPTSMLNQEKPLKTISEEIESNSKEKYLINIIGYESYLEIKIKALNKVPNKEYEERFSLDKIKQISKYFLICETINEVISSIEPYIKQSNIIEDKNKINLIISLNHPLCKEAIFQIKEKIKIYSSSELYYIISELRYNNQNQQNIINNQQEIIKDLQNKTNQLNKKQEETIKDFQNKIINLTERVNILENKIKETEEIKIPNLNEKIKLLEEELNKYKSNNTYNNFNIQFKKPIHKLNYHTNSILCSTVLKDGRFVTGSGDYSIIIYNNKTFKPDLTIKEHSNRVYCIIQLSSGLLASCSKDNTIKLYNINGNEYKVLQTLTHHTDWVGRLIELKNKNLVSCSGDQTIIFYVKDNNKYIKEYSISTNGWNGPVIQTKDNEICFYEETNSALCFYDLLERKIITKINNISVTGCIYDSLVMMTKDLLLATGENKLSIININLHNIIRTIDVSGSGRIRCACMLNENMLLTGDCNKRIIQWKIDGDNLQLISKKENAHESCIYTLSKIGNGLIISGSYDKFVKIW